MLDTISYNRFSTLLVLNSYKNRFLGVLKNFIKIFLIIYFKLNRLVDSKKPLRRSKKKQNQALAKYSEAIRSDLNYLDRLKFKAIVVIEIHARDVIEKMYKNSEFSFYYVFKIYHIASER